MNGIALTGFYQITAEEKINVRIKLLRLLMSNIDATAVEDLMQTELYIDSDKVEIISHQEESDYEPGSSEYDAHFTLIGETELDPEKIANLFYMYRKNIEDTMCTGINLYINERDAEEFKSIKLANKCAACESEDIELVERAYKPRLELSRNDIENYSEDAGYICLNCGYEDLDYIKKECLTHGYTKHLKKHLKQLESLLNNIMNEIVRTCEQNDIIDIEDIIGNLAEHEDGLRNLGLTSVYDNHYKDLCEDLCEDLFN